MSFSLSFSRLRELWVERSARERAAIGAGVVVVAVASLYIFLWEPGLAATRRLAVALPQLRAQVEHMRIQQAEIVLLRKSAGDARTEGDLRASLQASIARSPFAKSVQVVEATSERATVAVASASFDDWLRWVAAVQKEAGARLERSKVAALPEPGLVRVDATFVKP